MIDATGAEYDVTSIVLRRRSRVSPHTAFGAIALTSSLLVGAWILDAPTAVLSLNEAPLVIPTSRTTPRDYGALLDPALTLGVKPVTLAMSTPLGSDFEWSPSVPSTLAVEPAAPIAEAAPPVEDAEPILPLPAPTVSPLVQNVPLPTPRPPELQAQASRGPFRASVPAVAQQSRPALPAAPPDNRGFFEKLFGMQQHSGPALAYATPDIGSYGNSRRGPALAYATPDSGSFGSSRRAMSAPMQSYDRYTAVYDIAAHTVYMPDGARLEAHSGLGNLLDDPGHVHERNRGATPPAVYELQPRGQLFHGVQALRLNPVGGGSTFGRTGLLAHTYMLGPNGDSNGCVSFRNYNAFLQAFSNGAVKRLAVVARSS